MGRDTTIRELLGALHQLRDAYAACGVKTPEKTIAKVIDLLAPHDHKSLEDYAAEIRASAATGASKVASEPAAVNAALVETYVSRLATAGTETVPFEDVFVALSNDAAVKLKEADAIARGFTGRHAPFRTKKAALSAIRQTFVERVRFENKLRAVS